MIMIKKTHLVLALFLCSCSSVVSSTPGVYDLVTAHEAEQWSAKQRAEPFSRETLVKAKICSDDCFSRLLLAKDNALFSPLGYAERSALIQEDYDYLREVNHGLFLENKWSSCKVDGALASMGASPLTEAEITSFQRSGVSVYEGDGAQLNALLRDKYGVNDVPLAAGDIAYINQISMSDCFSSPWRPENGIFQGKEVPFAHSITECWLSESETFIHLLIRVNASSLRLLMAKEGHALEDITLENFGQVPVGLKQIHLHIPEFHIENYEDVRAGETPFRVLIQTSDFSFNRFGVAGKSVTVDAPTSSENDYEDIWLNRPFVFESSVSELPLFLGAVRTIA